jgi:urease gamma subunit
MSQVVQALTPTIQKQITAIWKESDTLVSFQLKLKNVRNFNTDFLQRILDDVQNRNQNVVKSIEALIVATVRILSSIQNNRQDKGIKLSLPEPSNFIHKVIINTARYFYEKPEYIKNITKEGWTEVVTESIDDAINSSIPFDDIISSFLDGSGGDTSNSNADDEEEDDEEEDESDEGVSGDDRFDVPVPSATAQQPAAQPMQVDYTGPDSAVNVLAGFDTDEKTVSLLPTPQATPQATPQPQPQQQPTPQQQPITTQHQHQHQSSLFPPTLT